MTEKFKQLKEPFPADDIEWRVQRCGEKGGKIWAMVLAYVTNRAIMNRLDDVIGAGNWKNFYESTPTGLGTLCGIAIRVNDEWVTKWDGAEDTAIEAVKGGLSGAMKRAAVQWGIGRYLYKLEAGYAIICNDGANYTHDKKLGKSFKWNPPVLPRWALPDNGNKGLEAPQTQTAPPAGDKGEFEQELEEKAEVERCVDYITELVVSKNLPIEGENTLTYFVFEDVELECIPLDRLKAGGKIIRAMLKEPSILDILKGKSDAPLFNPLAPPVTEEGEIETPINEYGENIAKISKFKELLGEAEYRAVLDNTIVGHPFKKANSPKSVKHQKAILQAMAERYKQLAKE